MPTYMIALLIVAAPPVGRSAGDSAYRREPVEGQVRQQAHSQDLQEQREIISPAKRAYLYKQEITRLLRKEATSQGVANTAAVLGLLEVHQAVRQDALIADESKKRLLGRTRSRLRRVAVRIEKNLEKKSNRDRGAQDSAVAENDKLLPTKLSSEQQVLMQIRRAGQALGQAPFAAKPGDALIELIKRTIQPASWDDAGGAGTAILYKLGQAPRRFQQTASHVAGFGGAASDDYGEELVELIQAVIAPDHWDVRGGPGSIYYFRNFRLLVIRASDEVHGDVADVMGQLRRAGN